MGWGLIWDQALKQFGAEDIQIRILIGLGAAFVLLMIVEGLRTAFRPVKTRSLAGFTKPDEAPTKPILVASVSTTPSVSTAKPAPQPARVNKAAIRATPKRAKPIPNRHRNVRPQIKRQPVSVRTPTFTEKPAP
jgi:hypothetical protein